MLRTASLQRGLTAAACPAGLPGLRSSAAAIIFALWSHAPASSQTPGPDGNYRIEAIVLIFEGTTRQEAAGRAFEDKLRSALNIFPGSTYGNLFLDFGLQKVRRLPGVKDARLVLVDGDTGGVILRLIVTLTDTPGTAPREPGFPVLAHGDDWLVKLKLTAQGLGYTNQNAWYGQPAAFLSANPLAVRPAGKGWSGFGEGSLEGGLQGVVPIAANTWAYGSLSWLASGSTGTDLFVTGDRTHGAIEDGYAGIVSVRTFEDGSRLLLNASAGRQAFRISDGMLIRLAAANGFGRAALQINPRWTADRLYLARARYNTTKLEVFRLDPDELPAIDTRTVVQGVNLETGLGTAYQAGITYLAVPRSTYGYFTTTAQGTRQGLQVADVRLAYTPNPGGTGLFAKAEAAVQWNNRNDFPMRAWGGYAEAGYRWADLTWSPSLSYRLSAFSGDRLSTRTFERWDPLLSGGSGEEWVQGLNHYKMVQDSNVIAHRVQAKLRPADQWELVPQLWLFHATDRNNIGGVLSSYAGRSLGWEANLTAKYFFSRNLLLQGSLAATTALPGVRDAIPVPAQRWFSAMTLLRMSF
ncbi:MAG: alginate export family protein [Burkholderiales bacterium]|nr:alginate export family protein [Burkholderiales bacterium]